MNMNMMFFHSLNKIKFGAMAQDGEFLYTYIHVYVVTYMISSLRESMLQAVCPVAGEPHHDGLMRMLKSEKFHLYSIIL